MRPTTIGSYAPPNFIKSIQIRIYCVIDVDTPILSQTPTIFPTTFTLADLIINDIPID